jgi:Tfp pilus assembly protein PilV
MRHATAGLSLVEVLVALVLVALAAIAALTTQLAIHRIDRPTARGAATDLARQSAVRHVRHAPACRNAPAPAAVAVAHAATPERPALVTLVRCGP